MTLLRQATAILQVKGGHDPAQTGHSYSTVQVKVSKFPVKLLHTTGMTQPCQRYPTSISSLSSLTGRVHPSSVKRL